MRLLSVLIAALLLLAGVSFLLRDLPPPDRIVFAAGSRDGGYWKFAERYRAELVRDGIEVEIIETAGSVENLGLLTSRKADVALLQGGIPTRGLEIVALGTVFVEPILVFVRAERDVPANPGLWRGLTIARGESGSGTRVAVDGLLDAVGVRHLNEMSDLGGGAAADALLNGEVDLAIFVAPLGSDYLQMLFASDEVALLRLGFTDAIALRMPHSRVVTVPSGAISLDPVLPAAPLPLVALMARLAAVQDLHPALVDRLVLAARKIHGDNSIFARQGQFPTAEAADLPIDAGALKLLAEGQSMFHDWLPYWIAAQIRRVLLVLLPLLFVVLPLVRVLPAVYRWSMYRRIWRHYSDIRLIEMELSTASDRAQVEALLARLETIDGRLTAMRLPPAFRGGAYNARLHIEMVRRRIAEMLRASEGALSDGAVS